MGCKYYFPKHGWITSLCSWDMSQWTSLCTEKGQACEDTNIDRYALLTYHLSYSTSCSLHNINIATYISDVSAFFFLPHSLHGDVCE